MFNSIVNKTPLSARTNRILGGVAPAQYLAWLEKGGSMAAPNDTVELDAFVTSHRIDPDLLKADDFGGFMSAPREALLQLIERAMGKSVYRDATEPAGTADDDGEDEARGIEADSRAAL